MKQAVNVRLKRHDASGSCKNQKEECRKQSANKMNLEED